MEAEAQTSLLQQGATRMGISRRRRERRLAAIALAVTGLAAANPAQARKEPEPPVEYGPPPSWDRFQELAEQAVRARLVDPDSAKFNWLWGYQQGYFKPMLAKRVHGYYSCGLINARNRMGGYTGNTYFLVVIDHDAVLYAEIAQNAFSILGEQCTKAKLPLLASMPAPPAPKPTYGIAFLPAPEGIRVEKVFPASPAERAGIKEGMIIARINGIALKGMPQATAQQVLSNLTGTATIELISGAIITVERP